MFAIQKGLAVREIQMDSVLLSLSIKVFKFESKMGIGALITFQDVVHIIH